MKHEKGFTLIELMIVVAIVAIISSIAIPQYKQYVIRGKRSAVQAFMMDVANREKQYLLDARVYTIDTMTTAGSLANLTMTAPPEVYRNYGITITVTATPSFLISAAPVAGSTQASDGTQTLDDSGTKVGTW